MKIRVSKVATSLGVGLACIAGYVDATPGRLTFTNNIASFENTFASPTTFDNFFTFTVPSFGGSASGTTSSNVVFSPTATFPVTFTAFNIFSGSLGSGTKIATGSNLYPFFAVVNGSGLASGNYYLEVAGKITNPTGGGYTGSLTLAPVPEPGEWALMLSGLGMLGLIVRRRTQNIS